MSSYVLYTNDKTEISIYGNPRNYIIFDNNQYPLLEMDEFGNVVKYRYDKTNYNLIYKKIKSYDKCKACLYLR